MLASRTRNHHGLALDKLQAAAINSGAKTPYAPGTPAIGMGVEQSDKSDSHGHLLKNGSKVKYRVLHQGKWVEGTITHFATTGSGR